MTLKTVAMLALFAVALALGAVLNAWFSAPSAKPTTYKIMTAGGEPAPAPDVKKAGPIWANKPAGVELPLMPRIEA